MTDIQMGAAEQKEARDAKNPTDKRTELKPRKPQPAWKAHKLGNSDFYLVETASEALVVAKDMKRLGHAITWDTVYESDGKFARFSVMHYQTCNCKRAK